MLLEGGKGREGGGGGGCFLRVTGRQCQLFPAQLTATPVNSDRTLWNVYFPALFWPHSFPTFVFFFSRPVFNSCEVVVVSIIPVIII